MVSLAFGSVHVTDTKNVGRCLLACHRSRYHTQPARTHGMAVVARTEPHRTAQAPPRGSHFKAHTARACRAASVPPRPALQQRGRDRDRGSGPARGCTPAGSAAVTPRASGDDGEPIEAQGLQTQPRRQGDCSAGAASCERDRRIQGVVYTCPASACWLKRFSVPRLAPRACMVVCVARMSPEDTRSAHSKSARRATPVQSKTHVK